MLSKTTCPDTIGKSRYAGKQSLQIFFFFFLVTQFYFAQWVFQNPMPTRNTLNDVTLIDGNSGWAVGDNGTIVITTNGGTDWALQESGTSKSLHGVCFINSFNGYAVGDSGTILRTQNGGMNWTVQTSGTIFNLNAVAFSDANIGWVVGTFWNGSFIQGIILNTTDSGITWISQFLGTYALNDVFFVDANNG